ncbi:MAG: hypothetical protein V1743_07330 [Nanoarchaeota archaeon]
MKKGVNMGETGAFCEVYGNTIRNQVLEYLLENKDLDVAVGDMAKELRISKPKAYEIISDFEKKKYVKKSRIVGKTRLYLLNKESKRIKLFLRDFMECLRLVSEEYAENEKNTAVKKNGKKQVSRTFLNGSEAQGTMSGEAH